MAALATCAALTPGELGDGESSDRSAQAN